ncbi:hypothetical protein niasHS_005866 [Heterodera schachtii]|uniref:GTP-binding protein Parf n=1 Tax=Heterodera schachtii TaxID=97005 RepID=A0ABD2JRY1_HETSC
MINALRKKFVATEEGAEPKLACANRRTNISANYPFPAGVNLVGAELQRKFATGIDYNMKILIRGDRNTGKTSLWSRLQGMPFRQEEEGDSYTQTEEIQVASITWNYRAHDFVVKLDIWDVVDKGRRADPSAGAAAPLKLGFSRKNASQSAKCSVDIPSAVQEVIKNAACDASTVNVYNGCDGVVMLFDVTRDWTWAYIRRELPSVPAHIPVLVMANKMDLISAADQPQPSTIGECLQFLRVFNERCKPCPNASSAALCPPLPLPIRFVRASMKSARGLKFLYNFFNIPFLNVQQNFLKNAMEANLRELRIAEEELDILAKEEGQNPTNWRRKSGELADEGKDEERNRRHSGEEDTEEEREEEEEHTEEEEKGHGQRQRRQRDGERTSPAKCAQFAAASRPRPSTSSSSSSEEEANPHVSTYAEDFDDGTN